MSLLFLDTNQLNAFWQASGWTLLHSLWIGLFAAAIAALVVICTRKSSARLRYNALGLTFIVFMAGIVISFICEYISAQKEFVNVTAGDISAVNSFAVSTEPTDKSEFSIWFNKYASKIVMVWALFFIFHLIKIITGLFSVNRLKYHRVHIIDQNWHEKLRELAARIGVNRNVQLLQSELVKVPVVVGYFKPVILLPLGLITHLPPEQAYAILLHELAHIRRSDYFVNVLQRLAEAIFFFNPAIIWISALIRQEREACCDDLVLSHINNKKNYLEALVSFQEYSLGFNEYALGISNKKQFLLQRVKRMLTRRNQNLNYREVSLLLLGFISLTAFDIFSKANGKTQGTVNQETGYASEFKGISSVFPVKDNTQFYRFPVQEEKNLLASKTSSKPIEEFSYARTKGIVLLDDINFRIPQDTPRITVKNQERQMQLDKRKKQQQIREQQLEKKFEDRIIKKMELENKKEVIYERNEEAEKRINQNKQEIRRANQENLRIQQEKIREQQQEIRNRKKLNQKIEDNKTKQINASPSRNRNANKPQSNINTAGKNAKNANANANNANANANNAANNATNTDRSEKNIKKNPPASEKPKSKENDEDLKLDKKPETKNERQLDSQEDNDILQDRSFSGHIKEFKIENNLKYAFNSRMTLSKDFQVKGIFRNYEPRVPNSKPPRVSPDPPHAPAPKQKVVI